MKARSASDFAKIFVDRLQSEPMRAVRLDISEDELEAVQNAYGSFIHDEKFSGKEEPGWVQKAFEKSERLVDKPDLIPADLTDNTSSKPAIEPKQVADNTSLKSDLAPDDETDDMSISQLLQALPMPRLYVADHPDPLLRSQGKKRAAFFGICYPWPEPREIIKPPRGTEPRKARQWATKEAIKLQRMKGLEYHVAPDLSPFGWVCNIWLGEDWIATRYAAYYPTELARLLDIQKIEIQILRDESKLLEDRTVAGIKSFNRQTERRALLTEKRQKMWAAWQDWIDINHLADKSKSFGFLQRLAAKKFSTSLKTIKRRTIKTWTT